MKRTRYVNRAALGYLVLGMVWVWFSDLVLAQFVDKDVIVRLALAQGAFFVAATGALFYLVLRSVPGVSETSSLLTAEGTSGGMRLAGQGRWIHYVVAIVLTVAMLVLRQQIAGQLSNRPMVVLLALPIVISAMVGGAGPGLVATGLAAIALKWLAIAPIGTLRIEAGSDTFQWLVLVVNGIIVSVMSEVLRRATLQAKADRALLQAVIESTPDAISVKDKQGRYILVNPTGAAVLGSTAEQMLGKRAGSFVTAEEAADLDAADQRALALGRAIVTEHSVKTPSGQRDFQSTRGPVVGPDGAVVGLFGMSRDITESKQARLELERSEGRLRLALEALREGLWDWDIRTGEVFRSERYYELIGSDATEDTGGFGFFASKVHPDDLPKVKQAIDEHLKRETDLIAFEFRLMSQGGPTRWLEGRGRVVERTDDGEPLRVVGTLSDITERRQEAAAMQEQRAQLNGIIESAMDAIVMIDEAQRIALFNPAAEVMFGRRAEQVMGEPLDILLPQEARSVHGEYVSGFGGTTAMTRRVGGSRPLTGLREDGSSFPIEASIAQLEANGQRYYTAILRDVTQRQIDERARSEAEAANRTKSSFLANMSHEIRTPMNAIIGLTHLMIRANPLPEQAERLNKIDVAGKHLLSIINDILDISKIEAGQVQVEHTDFHLSAILDNVQSIIAEQARAKGLVVTVDPDGVPVWLNGDPTRLRQALLNYVGNAIKFTECGAVEIRAILLSNTKSELLVRFEVQDTGEGIAEEELERLFLEFEQGDSTTTRKYGGSGLGLAISKRLAGLMGGEAGVQSEEGKGSTFWFTAKLRRGHGVVPKVINASLGEDAEYQLRRQYAGTRVLLVEDNPINLEVSLELLHSVGLAVDTAINGVEAVEKARAELYELVLMDMQMPLMDGVEATRLIKALPDWSTRPVLAMTANAFSEDREECREAGMSDFIVKPVDPHTLYRTLLKWLPHGNDDGTTDSERLRDDDAAAPKPGVEAVENLSLDAALAALHDDVDTGYGMAIMRGDRARYVQLLGTFARTSEIDMLNLQSAMLAGDEALAESTAHSLRGSSGSMGAAAVERCVANLEAAWKRNAPAEEQMTLLKALERVHSHCMTAIWAVPGLTRQA